MESTSRALAFALAALLAAAPAAASQEPREGYFQGERERLPAKSEREALGLLFEEADLFLAPLDARSEKAGAPRVYLAWKNPPAFSGYKVRKGEAARPRMKFLGWGLIGARRGGFAALAFHPSGKLLGAALTPKGDVAPGLRGLLEGLAGFAPRAAAERLRLFTKVHTGPEGETARSLLGLAGAFLQAQPEPPARAPLARVVPGLPKPRTTLKLLAVVLVILLAGLANIALARQRRLRERERERADAIRNERFKEARRIRELK